MKQKLIWPAIGLAAYLLFLAIHIPMSSIINSLPKYQGLEYSGVSGSFWKGKIESISFPQGRLSNFRWDTQWSKLFTAQLVSDVRFGSKGELLGKGTLGSGLFGNFAENMHLSLPISLVFDKLELPIPLSAKGELDMNIKRVSSGSPVCGDFDAQLTWLDAQLDTPIGLLNFEQVQALFSCEQGLPVAKIKQKTELLNLELEIRLLAKDETSKEIQLKGWLIPGAKMPTMMQSSLPTVLGQKDAQGRYPIHIKEKVKL